MQRKKVTTNTKWGRVRGVCHRTGLWFCASLCATCWVTSSIDMPAIVPRSLLICCRTRVNWSLTDRNREVTFRKQSLLFVNNQNQNCQQEDKIILAAKNVLGNNQAYHITVYNLNTLCIVGNVSPVSPEACPVCLPVQNWRGGAGERSYA